MKPYNYIAIRQENRRNQAIKKSVRRRKVHNWLDSHVWGIVGFLGLFTALFVTILNY